MKRGRKFPGSLVNVGVMCLCLALAARTALTQEARQKPAGEPAAKKPEKANKPEKAENPAQIELLETKMRFESNGDSRKEVHALVKINSELGVSQFARLNFDFNRSFEAVEIPLVHITHASGGTADILPSAITDQPNPAVMNAPAYQDVRVKSVRILGLQPGDTLEYRMVKNVSHHPLAPDFWVEHNFDRTGVVSHEVFELTLPKELAEPDSKGRRALHSTYMGNPTIDPVTEGSAWKRYRWDRITPIGEPPSDPENPSEPDIQFSSFGDWLTLSRLLADHLLLGWKNAEMDETKARLRALIPGAKNAGEIMRAGYEFTSKRLRTIDLPLGASGFRIRPVKEIIESGYATPEEKCSVLALFADMAGFESAILLAGASEENRGQIARPSIFTHVFLSVREKKRPLALDASLEVAPYGLVPAQFQGKLAFRVPPYMAFDYIDNPWNVRVPEDLPFTSAQRVDISAVLNSDGKLMAKAKYTLRGNNELFLRITFHQTPKEKWKELAQLLSITDGFRGQVTSVNPSDPYATKEPFVVEYELEQPKFVDWSKKSVLIPALLPQLGLPDPPTKPASGSGTAPIELGTPLEVETRMTLHLPPGTTATAPTGSSVARDYATYAAQYAVNGTTLTASRHIKFLLRQVPGVRAADYNAFLHAVRSDEAQVFAVERGAATTQAGSKP